MIYDPCRWCRGTGSIAVERGSSLRYRCTDCDGTGCAPIPDDVYFPDEPDDLDDPNDADPTPAGGGANE